MDLQGTNPEQAARLKQHLEATKAKLESANQTQLATLTKHDLVGDLLYGTVFNYFALNDLQDKIAAQSSGILSYRLPSYGIFSTSLKTQYWYGIPRHVIFGGLSMDMDHMSMLRVSKTNNNDEAIAFTQSIGARMSAMEHLVPEQMFSTETNKAQGISTVKALAIASQQGQKIWTINKDNVTLALNSINLGADTEMDIRNAVNAGKVVTTHEGKINFNGWVGEGYILMEPETGAGAYMIAGGANGSDTKSEEDDDSFGLSALFDYIEFLSGVFQSRFGKALGKLAGAFDLLNNVKAAAECGGFEGWYLILMNTILEFFIGLLALAFFGFFGATLILAWLMPIIVFLIMNIILGLMFDADVERCKE